MKKKVKKGLKMKDIPFTRRQKAENQLDKAYERLFKVNETLDRAICLTNVAEKEPGEEDRIEKIELLKCRISQLIIDLKSV